MALKVFQRILRIKEKNDLAQLRSESLIDVGEDVKTVESNVKDVNCGDFKKICGQ
jgi:hypothetical protein